LHPSTLIGWHLLLKFNPADLQQALRAFEQSVIADPKSASAQAGLAMALFTLSRLGVVGRDVFGRANAAAQSAVRLDPQLALAHVAEGTAYMTADWNIAEAEKSYRRAIALDSRCTLALVGLSQVLASTARLDEGLIAARQAASVDPVSPMIGVQLGMVLYSQHRFEDACLTFREVLHRERNFALAHYFLGLSSAYLGRYAEAEHHLSRSELDPGVLQTDFAWIELLQGNRAPAEKAYEQTRAAIRAGDVSEAACLLLAAWLGRFDDAFRALEIASRERQPEILCLSSDPRLEPLRKDPRYPKALKNLPFHARAGGPRYHDEPYGLDRVRSWSRRFAGHLRPGFS
jgi:tetratricopeptide (TPR) repeat protein